MSRVSALTWSPAWWNNAAGNPNDVWQLEQEVTNHFVPMIWNSNGWWQGINLHASGHPIANTDNQGKLWISYLANSPGYWSTLSFVAPRSGTYTISGVVEQSSNDQHLDVMVYKNIGGVYTQTYLASLHNINTTNKNFMLSSTNPQLTVGNASFMDGVYLNKGEFIVFKPWTAAWNSGVAFWANLDNIYVKIPGIVSNQMLIANDGTMRYADLENTLNFPNRDTIAILDHEYTGNMPQVAQGTHIAWIVNGVVNSIDGYIPGQILPGHILVVEYLSDWLFSHVNVGERLQVGTEHPFKPNTYTHSLNRVDAPIANDNEMVVYTPAMGTSTPANIFRRDLIVSNGRVVGLGGGNSAIPSDGFVVIAHGSSALWLSRWGMVGARVEYNSNQVSIIIDNETWFLHTQYYLDLVQQRLEESGRTDLSNELQEVNGVLSTAYADVALHPCNSWALVQDVLEKAKMLLYKTVESPAQEVRGVYLGNIPSSTELNALIERLKPAGINMVIPYLPFSITPTDNERLNSMALTLRAEGIKTVLWTWLPTAPLVAFDSVLNVHPEWSDRYLIEDAQHNILYVSSQSPDLANPDAMAWWTPQLVAFCQQTEIDGILFDYEGYACGYSQLSINRFIAQEGLDPSFDPRTITPGSDLAQKWNAWRKKLVVDAVPILASAVKQGKPGIQVVGCFNSPGYWGVGMNDGSGKMSMIWPEWLDMGIFDVVTTMSYAQNASWVAENCQIAADVIDGRRPYWPTLILWPETGGAAVIEPDLLIEQVEGVRQAGGSGILLFTGHQLMPAQGPEGEDLYRCLRNGLFRSVWSPAWWDNMAGNPNDVWQLTQEDPVNHFGLMTWNSNGWWQGTNLHTSGHPIATTDADGKLKITYLANSPGYWSSLVFVAPRSGTYAVSGIVGQAANDQHLDVVVYKNADGAYTQTHRVSFYNLATSDKNFTLSSTNPQLTMGNAAFLDGVSLNAGDFIVFKPWTSEANVGVAFNAIMDGITIGVPEPASIPDGSSSVIPGDANLDGRVDVGDLGILAANYGTIDGATWAKGDFNDDHRVDVGDLGILASHYGEGTVNPSSASFNTDYTEAFGKMISDTSPDDEESITSCICGTLGLPLIAGLFFLPLAIVNFRLGQDGMIRPVVKK
jgi:hypothetical protein